MKKVLFGSAILASLLFFTGCGGGGGTDTATSTTSTGVFVDAPVANLTYECTSGQSGKTNSFGEYKYVKGDECTFSAGNVPLGSVQADTIVTPKDLFGLVDFNDTKVINLAAFLWALDSDQNVTNGIQIDENITAKLDVNITDPNELFSNITKLVEELSDDDANLTTKIKKFRQNENEILTHLEKSELEAEYKYLGDVNITTLSRELFNNKTFKVNDETTLTFDANGRYTETRKDGTLIGSWTIIDDYLVLNFMENNNDTTEYIRFTDINGTKAKYIAFLTDGMKAGTADVTDANTSSGNTLDFTPTTITFNDIADKKMTTSDGTTILFYPDGRYEESGTNDNGTSFSIKGSWTVAGNYIVSIGRDNNNNMVVNYFALDANDTLYYFLGDKAGYDDNVTITDMNSSTNILDVTNRVALTKDLFNNKQLIINNSSDNTTIKLHANGEYEELGTSYKIEGSWTIVDNYLVLTGQESDGSPTVVFVAFSSINSTSATFTAFADDDVKSRTATISVLVDE